MRLALPFTPPTASAEAAQVDALFYALLAMCTVMAVGVAAAILYFSIKYRRGSRADRGHRVRHPLGLELLWTVIPLGVFFALFLWGAALYVQLGHPLANAMPIYVVGKQWMWKFQHPSGRREINELHLPAGGPVALTMISQDVIHDVFVPAFRLHHDVLPARYTVAWFTPTQVGRYHLFCSQYCGTGHAAMRGWVVVMSPADYQQWLTQGTPTPSLAEVGARRFVELGCAGCHAPGSSVHAPDLAGIYGRSVPLSGGGFAIADDQYLRDSILLPSKQVVAGFPDQMPSFQGQLDEEQILELVAYIRSLGDERRRP